MGRRKKKLSRSNNTLHAAFIFIGFVGALLVVSLLIKTGILIKKSNFDDSHRFTVAVSSKDEQEKGQKFSEVISFSPSDQSVSRLFITSSMSLPFLERYLEIPVDSIFLTSDEDFSKDQDLSDVTKSMVVRYHDSATSMTWLDVIRIWWFAHTVSSHSVTDGQILDSYIDSERDQISQRLFTDDAIATDKASVAVVNGTDILGFGNRFARLITNMGGSVISVASSDAPAKTTTIEYRGRKSYTVSKLEKILGVNAKPAKDVSFSDIIVNLGQDKAQTLAF